MVMGFTSIDEATSELNKYFTAVDFETIIRYRLD